MSPTAQGTTPPHAGGSPPPPISAITVPSSGKKKFGKNLNKLTAAPTAASTQQSNSRSSGKQDNGLLLLSNKRGSTSATPNATTGGGLLSNTTKAAAAGQPKTKLSLHTESCPSTHDALLGVVVGASRLEAGGGGGGALGRQLDAWRVAEFKQQDQEKQEQQEQQQQQKEDEVKQQKRRDQSHHHQQKKPVSHHHDDSPTQHDDWEVADPQFRTSNWDEYGGRDVLAPSHEDKKRPHQDENNGDGDGGGEAAPNSAVEVPKASTSKVDNKDEDADPNVYMAKKARERAAKRREEEENRMLAQKERAAQRLRELDEKAERSRGGARRGAETDSEHLNESVNAIPMDRTDRSGNGRKQRNENAPRTLFDPKAPSSNSGKPFTSRRQQLQQQQSYDRSPRMNGVEGPNANSRNGDGPRFDSSADRSSVGDVEEKQDVIQLSSYDDQDRGNNGATGGGPRMLFDPKSGSMVEAGAASTLTPKSFPNRERGGGRGQVTRSRNPKNNQDADAAGGDGASGGKEVRRGRKRREFKESYKESWTSQPRGRGGDGEASFTAKSESKKKEFPEPREYPRTRGVLYVRDEDGDLYSVDDCDGDLGYGAHSVPGGRLKNPEAFAKYEEALKHKKKEKKTGKEKKVDRTKQRKNRRENTNANTQGQDQSEVLQTGFHIQEPPPQEHEWVKPDDKIELITGVESPTLQATAKEFSPTTFKMPAEQEKKGSSSVGSIEGNSKKQNKGKDKRVGNDSPVSSFQNASLLVWLSLMPLTISSRFCL